MFIREKQDIKIVKEIFRGGFEQTVAFTHASITTSIEADTEADIVTIYVTANQKRDKFVGVAFGDELGETVKKAKDRVANPPRMNIIVPVPVPKNKLGETFIVEEEPVPLSSGPKMEDLVFSAFSMGSDLYNLNINNVTHFKYMNEIDTDDETKKQIARDTYNQAAAYYPIINPAEDFASKMNSLGYNSYIICLNNHENENKNPNKTLIVDAMKKSDIVYLATHGSIDGLWIQNIILDQNGYPTLKFYNSKLEFDAMSHNEKSISKLHFSEIKNIGNRLKWLIISGCSQLDRNKEGIDFAKGWADALIKNNLVHGVLGYYGGGPGYIRQNDVLSTFFAQLNTGSSIVDAWKNANERLTPISNANKSWAAIYSEKFKDDTAIEFSKAGNSEKFIYWGYEQDKTFIV